MSSIPKDIPFKYKDMPVYPGAYLVNAGYGSFPILCSIANFSNKTAGINDLDDCYYVMPGYQLIVYQDYNYLGYSITYPAIVSDEITFHETGNYNKGSSCILRFNGVDIYVQGIS
jgi:hypothetical protein